MHTANRKMANGIVFMMVVVLLELMLIISLLRMKTLTNCDLQFENLVPNEVGHTILLFFITTLEVNPGGVWQFNNIFFRRTFKPSLLWWDAVGGGHQKVFFWQCV